MAKTLFKAMVVLFILLGLFVSAFPVSAAQLIQCDAKGKCTANINYYPAYTGNIEHGLDLLGKGTDSWTISGNNVPVSFGDRLGDMNSDTVFVSLPNGKGEVIKAAAVCDLSAILHWYAVTQLGMTVTNPAQNIRNAQGEVIGHGQVPILPNDPAYRDVIYETSDGVYTADTLFYNPGSDVTIHWSVDSEHNLTIWNGGTTTNTTKSGNILANVDWIRVVGLLLVVVTIYYFFFRKRREEIAVVTIEEGGKSKKNLFASLGRTAPFAAWFTATIWLLLDRQLLVQFSGLVLGNDYGMDIVFISQVVFWILVWIVSANRSGYHAVRDPQGNLKLYSSGKRKVRWGNLVLAAVLLFLAYQWYFGGLRKQLLTVLDDSYNLSQIGTDINSVTELLRTVGIKTNTSWVDNLTQGPDHLAQLISAIDLAAAALTVFAIGLVVLTIVGAKGGLGVLLVGLLVIFIGKSTLRVDWTVLWGELAQKIGVRAQTQVSTLPQGDGTIYAGPYGALRGWGTLGEAKTPDQAIVLAMNYADKTRKWYTAGSVVPIVNVRVNKNPDEIDAIIAGCKDRCIVLIDMTPNQDVEGYIKRWTGSGSWVWFDIDLEHRGVPTQASEFNTWAAQYAAIRDRSGYTNLGVFAFYDFRSNPWLTPPSEVTYTYNQDQVLVIPIFDGHCNGNPCAKTKYDSTRASLGNYPGAPAVGIMEFIGRWGCGSVYGDCGFTPQDYFQEFRPLLFLSQ